MRIRSFHIDGFGIFSNVRVEALAPGLSIFLGNNEAGKSTCLDFLRVMLTGYPDPRSNEARERASAPLRGGQAGGSLVLETHRHGLVRLARRPGNGGGLATLADADGKPLDLSLLDHMLAGVTREVYRNVFGFSLAELQDFSTLKSEGVRHALYGASFGMGLRAPAQVLKTLEERMEALFKSGGSKPALNAALRQWETLRRNVERAEGECARFDALALERDQCVAALADTRRRRQEAETARRDAERRLGVWRQWDEWRMAGTRLARLEETPESFPHDGAARLERAQEMLLEASRVAQSQQERHDRVQAEWEAIEVDEALLQALPRIHALAERKESFRHARNTLPAHATALQRARAELARQLTTLGPDWTCERIRATDRSLFAREEMERQAAAMQTAASVQVAAGAALEKANGDVERAERDVAAAGAALARITMPVAALDEAGRDFLRRCLAQIEDARRRLPERRQALQGARAAFARTYGPLRIRAGSPPEQALEHLAGVQEQAVELAAEAQRTVDDVQAASRIAGQAQAAEDGVKGRLDRLRMQLRVSQGPATRATLDARAAALRALRHLHNAFAMEQDRLVETEARLSSAKKPAPTKSLPLMGLGFMFMLGGAAMLLARWFFGVVAFEIIPGYPLSVTLLSGYLAVFTGVGFLAGGLPRSGPEAERHAAEVEQLRARRESGGLRLRELETQIREQCVVAEVLNADDVSLDAAELLLEREREQCAADERLNLDLSALQAEWTSLREQTVQAQNQRAQAEAVVQKTRRRWHEFLQSCHVENIPAPEAAPAFFARVEAARVAYAGVAALEEEVKGLEAHLAAQERSAAAVPPVAELLARWASPAALPMTEGESPEREIPIGGIDEGAIPEAARRVLEACREADAAREERIKAAAALHNAESNMERASVAQGEAVDVLRRSEETLGTAREAWSSMLKEWGLGLELSPATAREALECMERCLAAEAEAERIEEERVRLERERDAFVEPLRLLEEGLGRGAPREDEDTDWAVRLDGLLAAAQANEDGLRRKTMLEAKLNEMRDELASARSARDDAARAVRALLDMACASSEEDFLRMAAVEGERRDLRRRMDDLEDALRLAAADSPLEEFLASFAGADQREREASAMALTAEIAAMGEEEQSLATRLAALTASLESLTTADGLAALRQEEAQLVETMRCMAHEWSRHALARHLLIQAKRRFEKERQPQVIRAASEIFASITEDRWAGLAASLEDSTLNVLPPHGEALAPEQISRGAQEQIYLAMRLAYIRNHAAHASALPVIMDDVLVNFDPGRARRTAAALLDLARQDGRDRRHQILFFTCHPHMADMLQEIMPDSARYLVNDGSIRKA